jgi:hypothetical protein
VELKFMLIAEYAMLGQDGRLSICGIIDNLTATLPPGVEMPAGPIGIPKLYLVAGVDCSLSEGTRHHGKLRLVNGSGQVLTDDPFIDLGEWNFVMNPHGVPMRFHSILQLNTVPMPELGECVFELWVDDKRLGDTTLHVLVNRADPEA